MSYFYQCTTNQKQRAVGFYKENNETKSAINFKYELYAVKSKYSTFFL